MSENPFKILTEEAVPDSRVRVDDVIAGGRARVRRRRGAVAGVCAAVIILVTLAGVAVAARPPAREPSHPRPTPAPSVSVAPPGCTVTPLDPGFGDAGPMYTDQTGRYVVFSRTHMPTLMVLFRDGARVHEFTGSESLHATAVNADGIVVGTRGDAVAARTPFRATADGGVTELRKPSGATAVRAYGINAAGDIAGEATMPGPRIRAVLWRHTALDAPVLLSTPAGRMSAARGIADDGRIVGTLDAGSTPYMWLADGTGAPLAVPAGLAGGLLTHIAGDWAGGLVDYDTVSTLDRSTGRRTPTAKGGTVRLARWHLSTGDVEAFGQAEPGAYSGGITTDGMMPVNQAEGAVLWRGGTTTALPAPDRSPWMTQVYSASTDGRVLVGLADPRSGGSQAPFRWDCRG